MKFLIFILIFSTAEALASEFYEISYQVKNGDTFTSILKSFVKKDVQLNKNQETVYETVKNNPQIKNWKLLSEQDKIKLFIKKSDMDIKYNHSSNANKRVHFFGIFFVPSSGSFKQSKALFSDISYKQISPLAFGSNYTYRPSNSTLSYTGSVYFSYILPTSSSEASSNVSGDSDVKIPMEIGANLYANYLFSKYNLVTYTGLDVERFSTFNMDEISINNKLYIDQHLVYYATFGLISKFNLINRIMILKLSFSPSLKNTYKTGAPNSNQVETIKGFKNMVAISYFLTNNFGINTFFKYQSFSGDLELKSTRIGLGVSYNFY